MNPTDDIATQIGPHLGQYLGAHVGPFLLALFRMGGLFIFAPIISSSIIPARVKLLLLLTLTAALYPGLPAAQQLPITIDLPALAPAIVGETFIGLTVGLLAAMPMYAAQMAGLLTSQQVGFGLASLYNPALETETDIIGQVLLLLGMAVFVALGGIEAMFAAVAGTFTSVPLAGFELGMNPLDLLAGVIASGFELALRVSLPVLAIITLETLATSILMKTIPQMNILTVGFAVKVILALVALIMSIGAIGDAIALEFDQTVRLIFDWTADLGIERSL